MTTHLNTYALVKILLVEDEKDDVHTSKDFLEQGASPHYDFECTPTYTQGFERLRDNDPAT